MLNIVLRFGGLIAAIALSFGAFGSWTAGEPPTWSFLAEKAEAHVVAARIESGRISNATMRHTPVVMVDLGQGPVALKGLQPSFFDYREASANVILAGYTPGATVNVRMIDGVAMADRQDLFQTAHASVLTVLAVVIGLVGAVIVAAFAPDRKTQQRA